jgi:hypothetical protein
MTLGKTRSTLTYRKLVLLYHAQKALQVIITTLKSSDAYQKTGHAELGRFISGKSNLTIDN